MSETGYLKDIGAAEVIDRNELSGPAKPLAKERWAGGVDSVGSTTLANLLSMTKYGGAIAACGLAAGMDLPSSVAPFILRGVCLLGIDSVMCPLPQRELAWSRLASDLDRAKLSEITHEIAWARSSGRQQNPRRPGPRSNRGKNFLTVFRLYQPTCSNVATFVW